MAHFVVYLFWHHWNYIIKTTKPNTQTIDGTLFLLDAVMVINTSTQKMNPPLNKLNITGKEPYYCTCSTKPNTQAQAKAFA